MELSAEQMARIERGAKILDEKRPGWQDESDFAQLDVDSFSKCPLCKVYGNFWAGIEQLFGIDAGAEDSISYGFYPHADDVNETTEQAAELARAKTNYWLKLIQERQS